KATTWSVLPSRLITGRTNYRLRCRAEEKDLGRGPGEGQRKEGRRRGTGKRAEGKRRRKGQKKTGRGNYLGAGGSGSGASRARTREGCAGTVAGFQRSGPPSTVVTVTVLAPRGTARLAHATRRSILPPGPFDPDSP